MADTLRPGYYKLSRDVENPTPDRRKTREVTALPVWKAGTRIAVLERPNDRFINTALGTPEGSHFEIEFCDDRHSTLTRRSEWDEMFKAIVPHLEPVEMDLDLTLHKVGHEGYYILNRLVRAGRVTLAQVEEAGREIDEEYAAETEAKK